MVKQRMMIRKPRAFCALFLALPFILGAFSPAASANAPEKEKIEFSSYFSGHTEMTATYCAESSAKKSGEGEGVIADFAEKACAGLFFPAIFPPLLREERQEIPLPGPDAVAESAVCAAESSTVHPGIALSESNHRLTLAETTVWIGENAEDALVQLGLPDREAASPLGFVWKIYTGDYTRFLMLGEKDGAVCAFATCAPGFIYNDSISCGSSAKETDNKAVRLLTDNIDGGRVIGVYAAAPDIDLSFTDKNVLETYLASQEQFDKDTALEMFDFCNAFRLQKGVAPLVYSEDAEKAALEHSRYMADSNSASHTGAKGSSSYDRISVNVGSIRRSAENVAWGQACGAFAFETWINLPKHRKAMLNPGYTYFGGGAAYNKNSDFRYYYTMELFTPM